MRTRLTGTAVAAVLLAAVALAGSATGALAGSAAGDGGGSGHRAGGRAAAEAMLLRLHELPRQYRIGDDSGCGTFGYPESEVSEALERWMAQGAEGCLLQYERLFRLPRVRSAQVIETEAIVAPSVGSAEEGFALAAELTDFAHGDGFAPAPGTAPNLGDAATLLRDDDTFVFGKTGRSASVLFWRSGRILGSIYVGGPHHRLGDRLALRLARLQQRHVAHPTAYPEAQRDWTTVPLEDPGIRFPVYWLGRTFKPRGGLPPARLVRASATGRARGTRGIEGVPGTVAELDYEGFTLRSWTAATWRRYDHDPILGPLVRRWKCTKEETTTFADRRLTVYAGYSKDFETCPSGPPTYYAAEVRVGGMVIGIHLPHCLYCVEAGSGPYSMPRGLETIARALRPRRSR